MKDRAFFFFLYEGYRLRTAANSLVTVPTLRMRNGDFSELLNTNDPAVRAINGGNPAYTAYYSDPTRFFGTAPLVNTDFRSDRFFTADMSILKKTRITETVTFEVGAEFFNVFNQVLFLPPDTFLGQQGGVNGTINRNGNFGAEGFTPRLNEAGNRVIQLRARLIF